MKNADKTKEQLLNELEELHRHVSHLEESDAEYQQLNAELFNSREYYRSILEASPN